MFFGAEIDKNLANTSIINQVDFWSDLLWIWGSIWEAFGREKGGKKVAKKRDEKKRATSGHNHPSGDFSGTSRGSISEPLALLGG